MIFDIIFDKEKAILQIVLGYLLGDNFDVDFMDNYRRIVHLNQAINESLKTYLKTESFNLHLSFTTTTERMKSFRILDGVHKIHNVSSFHLNLGWRYFFHNDNGTDVYETFKNDKTPVIVGEKLSSCFKFLTSSLKRLTVEGETYSSEEGDPILHFDWSMFRNCNGLEYLKVDCGFLDDDQKRPEEVSK